MAFRQLGPVGADQQRQVGEERPARADHLQIRQRLPQGQHPVGRVGQVLAPDDVGDPGVGVVDGVGQVEDRGPRRAHDHEVGDRAPGDGDLAPDDVGERADAVVGCPEPDRPGPALPRPLRPFVGRQVAAVPVVAGVGGPGRLAGLVAGGDLLLGAEALVGGAALEELPGRVEVAVEAVGLEVGPLVPVEAEPPQGRLDAVRPVLAGSFDVGVLDPQHERAALVAGVEPVEQGGAGAADVEEAGRGRREPDPDVAHARALIPEARAAGAIPPAGPGPRRAAGG